LFINLDVTADVLRLFISAVHGEAIELTNKNVDGLSTLCNEFQFLSLSRCLEVFKNTPTYQLEQRVNALKAKLQSLEERMEQHEGEISALQVEQSRQLRVQESIEQRIGTEAELASHRANEVESVRTALGEVRELAEGAQRKADSTEVQLGRVGRLEAEVLALRTVTVGENGSEAGNLSDPLREVREMAERAQRTAASMATEISALRIVCVPPPPPGWNSAIVRDFPKLFEDFKPKQFPLLWRGSRDGFRVRDFHRRCDGHANTVTVILDTDGNIFGGFTPVKSAIFTLKNPHNVPAGRFPLEPEGKDWAIYCKCDRGPHVADFAYSDNCNAQASDTGATGTTFFTISSNFPVKEIEVFELTD
jgi:hypothetical protein